MVTNWLISCNIVWGVDFFIISICFILLMFIMLIEWEGRGVNFFCQSLNLPTYPPVFYPPYILTYRPTNFIPSYKTTQLIKLEEACQWSSFSHVENSPILPTFCFTSLCAWSRKLATAHQPIRCKTNINNDSFSCAGSFLASILAITITLVLVLRNYYYNCTINNGSRNEWSPIRSVIMRVIHKIGRLRSGGPIC